MENGKRQSPFDDDRLHKKPRLSNGESNVASRKENSSEHETSHAVKSETTAIEKKKFFKHSLVTLPDRRQLHDIREKLQEDRKKLPVYANRKAIVKKLSTVETLILLAGTGSGKTTQIPQVIYRAGMMKDRLIACTQPRRVAAISVAQRVAAETGTAVGELVGYRVRFEDVTTSESKIIYMTDGMLLREALLDPLLRRYSIIILDEAHERTVNTDILFGVVKAAQKRRAENHKNSLKVMVMSATMDGEQFANYFNNAKGIVVRGRQHKLSLVHLTKAEDKSNYMVLALVALFRIHENHPANNDVLVFLTGQEEIEQFIHTAKHWELECDGCPPLMFCPMYSSLPQSQLLQVFEKTPEGSRKVVVATNIAETSITIPGITFVVDSGVVKSRSFNSQSNNDVLAVQRISQAQALQREGRANREAPGTAYKTYTEEEFNKMPLKTVPEIQRTSMATVVLQLLKMGIRDVMNFDFMDKPTPESISNALDLLYWLGAVEIDSLPKLTPLGHQMAAFPIDPRLAKVLLAAKDFECLEDVLTIVSLLTTDSVLVSPPADKKKVADRIRDKFFAEEGDHLTLLNVYRAYKKSKGNPNWCEENYISARNMRIVVETRRQLRDICVKFGLKMQSTRSMSDIRKCFVTGFFMNACEYHPDAGHVTVMSKEQVHIHPSSVMRGFKSSCVIFNELVRTGKLYMRDICLIDKSWLQELTPASFKARKPYKTV